ncbi:AraC family transcriptional regulator [Ochrobactrum sp. EGD-AQ16]|uniref:Helix-turn-helix domain-containing protein n=2 Tax=Brucella/Ochrobactrum group TaxID=2826938 RepID=M5JXI1_9HYPH|nr:helix-turn-helix domain-containing protein [Brucella intermedia M86]ERI15875.1 AraC family transcriptional regulator [Ochrobactrum sp. EGD-AQ16]SUA87676.1 Arabinose operon regulatory protein [Brucella intermedia]
MLAHIHETLPADEPEFQRNAAHTDRNVLGFWHSMIWQAEGIRVVAPVQWRVLDGLVSVYWEAESQTGANGYFLSHDPRIMIFFQDVSSNIRISNDSGVFTQHHRSQHHRPMTRAIYIPAGVPMWTNTVSLHRFSHLNLHFHKDRLLKYLSPTLGASMAMAAMRSPVEIQDLGAIETLARLIVDETANPTKHGLYAENLIGSILTGLLDIPGEDNRQGYGRLTMAQMNRLNARFDSCSDRRLSVAEMAAAVGLSESWFANVFKQTTGKTPLQWQMAKRIDRAQQLLAESDMTVAGIAAQLGFTDQAHLTKAFRQVVGETPAAWRRFQSKR